MRLATPLALLVLLAALTGCGGSSGVSSTDGTPSPAGTSTAPAGASTRSCQAGASGAERLRATGTTCVEARHLASGWRRARECDKSGPSRSGCSLLSYRCQSTVTGRGWSVSCSQLGRSVAFTVRR